MNSVIKTDKDITTENMKKLSYLDCILTETSRMYCSTPSTFQRIAAEDISLGGVLVPKGTLVDMTWINFLYNPDVFVDPL